MRNCLTSKDNEIIKASSQARHPVSLFTIKGLILSDLFYISTAGWGTFPSDRLRLTASNRRRGDRNHSSLHFNASIHRAHRGSQKKRNLIGETEDTQKTSLSGLRQEALFQFCMAGRRQCDGARKDRHRRC